MQSHLCLSFLAVARGDFLPDCGKFLLECGQLLLGLRLGILAGVEFAIELLKFPAGIGELFFRRAVLGIKLLSIRVALLNLSLQITKHPRGFLGFDAEFFQTCLGALFFPFFCND